MARNPVLSQEITNGHAARMRFSRFRQQVLGLQPQKRNRTGAGSKSRVTKKKKEDDHPRPKKEDEEETKSGSGIGNIKTEGKAIKSERKSISECVGEPGQPPAPMMPTPDMMKTEAGIANPYSQHPRQPSVISVGSPSVKQERLPSTGNPHTATPLMTEPSPFGILATTPAASSTSSTPYIDNNHHRMQMRLLTPSSDTDGMSSAHAFLPQSPCPSTAELLQHNHGQYHSQRHHSQQHHHHQHALVGAGSPPLSASAPSPYDFSQHQHGCDIATTTATTVNSSLPATDSSPWHSQHQHHSQHHNSQHSQSQCQSQIYPTFGLGIASSGFTALDYNNTNTVNSHPFCPDHHPSHLHHHLDEDAPHDMVDSLGLHHSHSHSHSLHHHHEATAAAAAAAMEGGMFRERELELGLGIGVTNHPVKGEWDGEGFGI